MVYNESIVLAGGKIMKKFYTMIILALCSVQLVGCGKSQETEEQQLKLRSEGMQQALEGDYEAAINSYQEALELSGMSVGSLERDIVAYKASALYYLGETTKAIDCCSAILDMKESAEIYLTRGLIYREMGDTTSAKADFAKAMELTSSKDKIMLGRLSYYMEDYTSAKKYLESAYKDGNVEALYWQGELYWDMGNREYAVSLYKTYMAGDAQEQKVYDRVAGYQMEQGDYAAALEIIKEGIAKGNAGSLQGLLAKQIAIYEYQGDFASAKQKMEKYVEAYPEDENALREYEFLKSR